MSFSEESAEILENVNRLAEELLAELESPEARENLKEENLLECAAEDFGFQDSA